MNLGDPSMFHLFFLTFWVLVHCRGDNVEWSKHKVMLPLGVRSWNVSAIKTQLPIITLDNNNVRLKWPSAWLHIWVEDQDWFIHFSLCVGLINLPVLNTWKRWKIRYTQASSNIFLSGSTLLPIHPLTSHSHFGSIVTTYSSAHLCSSSLLFLIMC